MWLWSRLDDDLDQVMIQIWWWYNDDPVVMIMQISWWRRLEEEDDLKMKVTWRWRSLEDEGDLKMKNNWRRRRLEDEDNLKIKTTWRWWCRDDPVDTKKKTSAEKLCWKNTFLVKRECWCICNFGMYSSMYMYCNPMFILRCIYYVIESFCHASMFWLGGSIM